MQPGDPALDAHPEDRPGPDGPASERRLATGAAPAAPRRGASRLRLSNWRVPARLIALILIPTTVAVALGGLRVAAAANDAGVYDRVERLARLGGGVAALTQEFGYERDLSAGYIAGGRSAGGPALQAQYARVDTAVKQVRRQAADVLAHADGNSAVATRAILNRLDGVAALRELTKAQVPADTVQEKYSESLGEMISFLDNVAEGSNDERLAASSRALVALSRAKEQASRERAVLYAGAITGRMNAAQQAVLLDARAQEDGDLTAFRTAATLGQRQFFDDTVTGTDVDKAAEYRERAIAVGTGRLNLEAGSRSDAIAWLKAMSGTIDKMRTVERRISDDNVAAAASHRDDATRSAIVQAVVVALVLLAVLLLTFIVARSLVRPLRRLQEGALEVAGSRLPGLVDRLRDPEAAAGGIEVEPINVDSSDEIGQVARAFDEVHREAVRLAADEAVLRGNINAMFVNLSRRSQSLIESQLQLIEKLEQSERDEEQLANLFRLDHLATRMRRNSENLLVLGGQDQVRRRSQPVPLIDVVRASLSEVEQYERISLRVHGDMLVAGPVVNDLVHLLAELVENATVFSSEQTKVTVSGQLLSGGGAMLQINDNGVGMAPDVLEQANWRLANPPVIDFAAARRMGLFVVGRLAVRHGIRVELRAAQGGGLTAFVMIPDGLIIPGESTGGVGARRQAHTAAGGAPVALAEAPPAPGGVFAAEEPRGRAGTGPIPRTLDGGGYGRGEEPGGRPSYGAAQDRPGAGPRGYEDAGRQPGRGGTSPLPVVPDDQPLGRGQGGGRRRRPAQDTGGYETAGHESGGYEPGGYESGGYESGGYGTGGYRTGGYDGGFDTGARQAPRGRYDTGAQPAVPGDRRFDTGPIPRTPDDGRSPLDTGPLPPVHDAGGPRYDTGPLPPVVPEDGTDRSGELPVRRPGSHLPGRAAGAFGDAPAVPEAQPALPDPARPQRPVSWDTGPLPETPADPRSRDAAAPLPAPFTLEEPHAEPPAPEPPARPAPPAPERRAPAAPPARSPIFDAMQSEWFQRRDGGGAGTQDPVKGWTSAGDAGFEAAAAAAKPVAGRKTSAGLPKRVPGKNRVPGAVPTAQPAPQPQQGAAEQEGAGAGFGPQREQSAEQVRDRFASLQRGVYRGRNETRDGGPADSTSERPSWNDGETGGTR
ncbi:sensor histidine kinase [Actinomadura parmotrematis]|nr:nitrate- and nitrite sensing domain-containing protein [Actinomadura parmotrematis]